MVIRFDEALDTKFPPKKEQPKKPKSVWAAIGCLLGVISLVNLMGGDYLLAVVFAVLELVCFLEVFIME